MSWDESSTQTWSVKKYVDLRSNEQRALTGPGLVVRLNRSRRLLRVYNSSTMIEQILLSHPLSALFRDTAVIFSHNLPSHFIRFRIRLYNTSDRVSLCGTLFEFISVQESSPSNSQLKQFSQTSSLSQSLGMSDSSSQLSSSSFTNIPSFPIPTISPYGTLTHLQPIETHRGTRVEDVSSQPFIPCNQQSVNQREVKEAQTQTEPSHIWTASSEQLKEQLLWLLRDTSFLNLVEKIEKILPSLNTVRDPSLPLEKPKI